MPKQIELIQIETLANRFHFVCVPRDRPEAGIVCFFGVSRIELVVVIEFDSVEWQKVFEPFKVSMICTGAAMQEKNLGVSIANFFRPDPMATADLNSFGAAYMHVSEGGS